MQHEQLVSLNNEIATYAKRKQLRQARIVYEKIINAGAANSHTFAGMVNACVQCGEIDAAEAILNDMKAKQKRKDVVVHTTLMKGYCAEGRLTRAMQLYHEMSAVKPVQVPNIRTINTLLRGCLQVGSLETAEKLFAQSQKDFDIAPDTSAWEYYITLLCQSLNLEKVLPMVGRLKSDPVLAFGSNDLINISIQLARAAVFIMNWKVARKTINSALALLASDAEGGLSNSEINMIVSDEVPTSTKIDASVAAGGKRAWRCSDSATTSIEDFDDRRRLQSLAIYREHSRAEQQLELQRMQAYIDRMDQIKQQSTIGHRALSVLLRFLPIVSVEGDEAVDVLPCDKDIFAKRLVKNIRTNYGLSAIADMLPLDRARNEEYSALATEIAAKLSETVTTRKSKKKYIKANKKSVMTPKESLIRAVELYLDCFSRMMDDDGNLLFHNIFHVSAATASEVDPMNISTSCVEAPLKLEIGSGVGEWAVEQAVADPESKWITLELRHDRAYQTLIRSLYAGAENICVLAGDALSILPRHFQMHSLENVFVNHPEPPQQTNRTQDSQSKHMLRHEFFLEMSRVIKPGGQLTIVTDNLWYGKLLISIVAAASNSIGSLQPQGKKIYFEETSPADDMAKPPSQQLTLMNILQPDPAWHIVDKCSSRNGHDVYLYSGVPGTAAGHVNIDASSYFDRLWKREDLVQRYFLVLQQPKNHHDTTATAASMTVAAVENEVLKSDASLHPKEKKKKRLNTNDEFPSKSKKKKPSKS